MTLHDEMKGMMSGKSTRRWKCPQLLS